MNKQINRMNNRTRILNKLKYKNYNEKMAYLFDAVKNHNLTCKNMKFIIENIQEEEWKKNVQIV